jgi:hypothetical protein
MIPAASKKKRQRKLDMRLLSTTPPPTELAGAQHVPLYLNIWQKNGRSHICV